MVNISPLQGGENTNLPVVEQEDFGASSILPPFRSSSFVFRPTLRSFRESLTCCFRYLRFDNAQLRPGSSARKVSTFPLSASVT